MSDFILALAVILMFAFVLFFLKKVNYFLGENRKVIAGSKMMTMIDVFMDYY